MRTGSPTSPPSRPRAGRRQRPEAVERQAVVVEQHRAARRRQRVEPVAPGPRAGHGPERRGELVGEVPVRAGPDVLGVGRAGPGQARHQAGVADDARRRVDEMGVEVGRAVRQLVRQHQRLAEAAQAVAGRVARQVPQQLRPRGAVAGAAAHPPPRGEHAERRVVQVFRQVAHGRPHFRVHRMGAVVGGAAQRHDADVEAAALQAEDLLGDEGFGQPGIALQHEDRAGPGRGCGPARFARPTRHPPAGIRRARPEPAQGRHHDPFPRRAATMAPTRSATRSRPPRSRP